MTGTVMYTFGDTPAGVRLLFDRVLVMRAEGFKTHVTTFRVGKFTLHTLAATAPVHASRRERGLLC